MPLPAGTRIGPYEIRSLLGAGGMGEVFLAHDDRLGRDVALKVLPAEYASDADRLRRFEIEARAASQLNHPNILTVFDVGADAGRPYVVAERLEGETLRDRLARGPLAEREALDIARQVARGLAAAHARNIIHRDLKPENLFLTRDGHVKILDFGLAKLTSHASGSHTKIETAFATEAGVIVGTVQYMAPEQVKGQQVDQRADLFSFGVVLYEMLTGQGPFTRPSRAESMSAVLSDTPRPIDEARPGSSPLMARVIEHCLEKAPEQRFQSARDLLFALESAGARASTSSGPAAPSTPATPARRLPLAVVIPAVGVIALAAGWWLGTSRSPHDQAPTFKRTLRFVASEASEFSPGLSPDGKWLAYLSQTPERTDVWVKFLSGGEAVNLTRNIPDLYVSPRNDIGGLDVSPDGTQILFPAGALNALASQMSTYVIAAPLGGAPRKLIDGGMAARWSPDGAKLVYVKASGSAGDSIWVSDATGENARSVVPIAGGIHTHWPAWSADSRFIYYVRSIVTQNMEPSEIYRVSADGGTPEAVIATTRRATTPWPGTDGSGLLYSANPASSELALWWMPTTGAPARVTTGAGDYMEAQISADRRTLVATFNQDRRSLALVKVTEGPHQFAELTPGSSGDLDPALSPKRDRLAFSSTRNGLRHIWTSGLDGSDAREVTSGDAVDEHPAWSPDASTIAFVSSRGVTRAIWLVAPDGSGLRKVIDAQVIDQLTWSPDGRELAYSAPAGGVPAIFRVKLSGGGAVKIETSQGATSPSWSAVRNEIAFVSNSPAVGAASSRAVLGIVTPDGRPVPVAAWPEDARVANGWVCWSPDGRFIAALSNPGNRTSRLWIIDVAGGSVVRQVVEFTLNQRTRGLAWLPDQSAVIVGVSERTSDIVLFDQGQ